jgi:hypothetical protein
MVRQTLGLSLTYLIVLNSENACGGGRPSAFLRAWRTSRRSLRPANRQRGGLRTRCGLARRTSSPMGGQRRGPRPHANSQPTPPVHLSIRCCMSRTGPDRHFAKLLRRKKTMRAHYHSALFAIFHRCATAMARSAPTAVSVTETTRAKRTILSTSQRDIRPGIVKRHAGQI